MEQANKYITPADSTQKKPNIIRRLYNWTVSHAEKKNSRTILFVVAFIESVFFPIPPDVLLIPLCYTKPRRALWFATICLTGSVTGAVVGYLIGLFASDAAAGFFTSYIFSAENFLKVKTHFDSSVFYYTVLAAFTPIPYKVFTITAGIMMVNLPVFITASIMGRGARFFLIAVVIAVMGERGKKIIEEKLEFITIVAAGLVIIGVLILKG